MKTKKDLIIDRNSKTRDHENQFGYKRFEKKSSSIADNLKKMGSKSELQYVENHNARENNRPERLEVKIYGINACLNVFQKRPTDIVKVYLLENEISKFSHVLKYCADKKIAYKLIKQKEELEKISDSAHHEGVVFIVKSKKILSLKEFKDIVAAQYKDKPLSIVALEGVENPHNVGAICRVCANFDVSYILVDKKISVQNASVIRTAEGGFEWLSFVSCEDIFQSLKELKEFGFRIVSTSSHVGRPVHKLPSFEKNVIVFGSERDGISQDTMKLSHIYVSIPSSGNIESLNVSCAASVILYELWNKRDD